MFELPVVAGKVLRVQRGGGASAGFTCSVVGGAERGGVSPHGPVTTARAAAKRRQERLAELLVHEAIGDRVAAGRKVGQQVNEVHGKRRDVAPRAREVHHRPRVRHVQRRPTHEELEDDHKEHADDSALRRQTLLRVRVSHMLLVLGAVVGAASPSAVHDGAVAVLLFVRVGVVVLARTPQLLHLWQTQSASLSG